jgi:3-dehydroquinate dehydratase/shikimate dehydrogenase
MTLQGAKILVLGAGGVARAAAFGLKNKGAEVFITNRTPEKGQALARQAKAKYLKRADVAKSSFDVIVNATPLGMGSNKQTPLDEKELNTKYLFDLVYVPAETKLMRMARAKNIQIIPGLEMFVQQGARQFEIWTGKPAPIAEMSFVVSKALERMAAEAGEDSEPVVVSTPVKAAAKPEAETPAKKPGKAVKVAPAKKPAKPPGKKKAKAAPVKAAKKAVKKAGRR